jgi:hypothetical protein
MIVYTNAPEDYDGFGTVTKGVVGQTERGPMRMVQTVEEHHGWQLNRYYSGGVYFVAETGKQLEFHRMIGDIK